MPAREQAFAEVFGRLRAILSEYEDRLALVHDTGVDYYLNTRVFDKKKRPIFFGAAKVNKGYVSYYLMSVYYCPDLLAGMSEGLRKRMQGKSCFNFTKPDEAAFGELAQLTARGFDRMQQEGLA